MEQATKTEAQWFVIHTLSGQEQKVKDNIERRIKVEERQEKVAPKVVFEKGETVKVTEGAFQNFTGVIEDVDPARGKLKISVAIFGRSTSVELEYWQVERA